MDPIASTRQQSVQQTAAIFSLPSEMFSTIFSFLPNPEDFSSVALTCRSWTPIILDVAKQRQREQIKTFIEFVCSKLDPKYSTQSGQLKSLLEQTQNPQNLKDLQIPPVDSAMEAKIKTILTTVEQNDLKALFNSFTADQKTPLFYRFVFLSSHHESKTGELRKDLENKSIYFTTLINRLNEGAVLTEEIFLDIVKRLRPEQLKQILCNNRPQIKSTTLD